MRSCCRINWDAMLEFISSRAGCIIAFALSTSEYRVQVLRNVTPCAPNLQLAGELISALGCQRRVPAPLQVCVRLVVFGLRFCSSLLRFQRRAFSSLQECGLFKALAGLARRIRGTGARSLGDGVLILLHFYLQIKVVRACPVCMIKTVYFQSM